MNELADVFAVARDATFSGLAFLGVVALAKGWVVTRGHYDDMRAELHSVIDTQREIIRRLRNGEDP